jgi:hypothetical protein
MASITRPTLWSAFSELVGDVLPRGERRVARGELGVGGDHAEFLLLGEDLFSEPIPALVELPLVSVGPSRPHVVRRVAAAGREVDEEGLVGLLGSDPVEPSDRSVGHRIGQVVRVLVVVELGRGADDLLVLRDARVPLTGVAAEEPVEIVEPPPVRPAVERARRPLLPVGSHVPLPEGRGAVAVVPQDPGQRRAIPREDRRVPGVAAGELADRAEPDRVVVATRQERGSRRGA